MKITIAEPVLTNELEQFNPAVAEHTRKLLVQLFPEQIANGSTAPIPKEELKLLKEKVQNDCETAFNALPGAASPEDTMLRVLGVAGEVSAKNPPQGRWYSYRVEYAFQWARAYLFKNKLPNPSEYPANAIGALMYPRGTSGFMDYKLGEIGVPISRLLDSLRYEMPAVLCNMLPHPELLTMNGSVLYDGVIKSTEVQCRSGARGIVYTEEGTAWFAGFLSVDDVLKLRFRRMRLGAAVKELTGDDELARKAADIRDLNEFDLVLHPNDRPFGEEYIRMCRDGSGLDSCMTRSAESYDAPFDVHPCDVYSCAHYGQGDNGLVLVEARQDDTPVGRGILNVNTKQIVRWYGEYKAGVMLERTFNISIDTDALDDVQLALIQDGSKIAAPYLDGCQSCDIEGEVLVVRSCGDIEMDDTYGYQWCCARQQDVCSGEYYPEDEMEYQPIHDTYYHPRYTQLGVLCPITEEYCYPWNTSSALVDGEETYISDAVYFGHIRETGSWENLGGSIGWTENSENYSYDDETEEWYTNEQYDQLIAEREEQEEDKDEAA